MVKVRVSAGYHSHGWADYLSLEEVKKRLKHALSEIIIPHSYVQDGRVFRVGVLPDIAGSGNYTWEINAFTYNQFVKAFATKGIKLPVVGEDIYTSMQMDEALYRRFRKIFYTDNYEYKTFNFIPSYGEKAVPIFF